MRRIRWAVAAADDLQHVSDYLRENSPDLLHPTIRKLYDAARSLKRFPHRGRVGQLKNTRELILLPLPYVIVYGVEPETVHIFRIIHMSQDWPDQKPN